MQSKLHMQNTKVALASLAYADMASEHSNRKVKHESHEDVIDGCPPFTLWACRIDNVAGCQYRASKHGDRKIEHESHDDCD